MNWPRIEALVYSEEDEPQEILGPHKTEEGILVQAFLPTAVKMTAVIRGTGKEYEMELADEGGFFAVLLPGKTVPEYFFRVEYDNGVVQDLEDAYRFQPKVYSAKDLDKFEAGKKYVYDITVNRTGLGVTSTIEDWTPGNGENGEQGEAF